MTEELEVMSAENNDHESPCHDPNQRSLLDRRRWSRRHSRHWVASQLLLPDPGRPCLGQDHAGAVKQSIAVITKRSGRHTRTIREFALESGRGIRIGGLLREFRGLLTGMPEFHDRAEHTMEHAHARK